MIHTLFEDHKRFFAKYQLRDDEGYVYSDKIQFYVMDLKAINEATEQERQQGLTEWANAFSAHTWEQVQRIENPAIKEAVKQMRTIMNTPEQRQIVWDRKMAELDYRSQMSSMRREALQEGRNKGANDLGELIMKLIAKGRDQDIERAASDPAYREKLYAEFGIAE